MSQRLFGLFMMLCMCIGCSSPDPPAQFLYSKMKIAGYKNKDGTPKQMHMRPIDLYNAFDIDVSKKWKKHTVNSWNLIIKIKEPARQEKKTLAITITSDISMAGSVIINRITVNKRPMPGMIAEIVKLDEAFGVRNLRTLGSRKINEK